MLDEFRSLGGVADNIGPVRASPARGLFHCDPAKPFLLRVPENLCFPVGDIEFVEEGVRIRSGADAGPAERDFFDRYQKTYCWGAGGQSEAAALISLFDTLPAELRASLAKDFAMRELLGDRTDWMRRQFLRSRMIYWNNRQIFAPVVERVRRSADGIAFGSDQHGNLLLGGQSGEEIFATYGPYDCLDIFRRHGVPIARPYVFSLPMKIKVGAVDLSIARNVRVKKERSGFPLPEMKSEADELFLSHLMVGNSNFPRASRGIFDTLMRDARAAGSAEAFDRVLHFKRKKFLQLLELLEPLNGEMVGRLRRMAHFQLEALFHCVGTREL